MADKKRPAKKAAKKVEGFAWWDGADIEPFFKKVASLGGPGDLQIRLDDKGFWVRRKVHHAAAQATDENWDGPFNFTHTYPPDSP